MVTRRPSSAQYKKTSRQMRRATLGTHVARVPNPLPSRTRELSNPRRTRKAERGEIHQVLPNTSTRESRREYENRMSQQAFIERAVASGRRRRTIAACVLGALALAVACAAAWFVFMGGIDSRLRIEDSALAGVLADAPQDGPAYTLLSASFNDGDGGSGPDVALLVRTDPAAASASMVVIPGNIEAKFSDGKVRKLGEASSFGGDAETARVVESLAGVQLSHYVKTDADGFVALIDALGGIEVDVPERIVDPDAGSMTLSVGLQKLDGAQALFMCRANDFPTAAEQRRGVNEALVVRSLFESFVGMDRFAFYRCLDALADCVQTDMDAKGAYAFVSALQSVAPSSVTVGVMPTYATIAEGVAYQSPIADEWKDMMGRFIAGEAPQQDKASIIGAVDPSSFSVTVNNGGSVEGAAADASSLLKDAGFKVDSVGNANQAVYDTTLVVYQKADDESKAEAIVATLGVGRAVLDSVNYSFETDILVVVGKDWQGVIDARQASA